MLAARLRFSLKKWSHTTNTPSGIFLGSLNGLDDGAAPVVIDGIAFPSICGVTLVDLTMGRTGVGGRPGGSSRVVQAEEVVLVKPPVVEP